VVDEDDEVEDVYLAIAVEVAELLRRAEARLTAKNPRKED
jgi:hypothetical protein